MVTAKLPFWEDFSETNDLAGKHLRRLNVCSIL